MRTPSLAFFALAVLVGPALAQQAPAPAPQKKTIGGELPPSDPLAEEGDHCVEVEIGNDKAFNCLNSKLKRQTDRVVPVPNIPPIDATSPDLKLGIVNVPAVKQQYGKNFGKSAIPYRPAPPVHSNPFNRGK